VRVNFRVRKCYANKNKNDDTVSSYRFVCSKEGLQKTSKSDPFVKIHNHHVGLFVLRKVFKNKQE